MTQPASLFSVTLRHLSSDGKKASAELPNSQLHYVTSKDILGLLRTVAALAPQVAYPAEPEIRISGGGREFVVRVKTGQLHLVSWSSAHKGGVSTPEQIVAAIAGDEAEAPAPKGATSVRRTAATAPKQEKSSFQEKLTLIALGVAIIGVNCFTVWFIMQPPRSVTAKYKLLAPEQAKRVLEDVAGAYETGKGPGDRRLEIGRDATVNRIKFGAGGAPKDHQTFTVQPAESAGKTALLTSRKSLIIQKDNISLVLYGDTYSKVTN